MHIHIYRYTTKLDPDIAEDMYTAALKKDPNHVPTLVNYAYFLEKVYVHVYVCMYMYVYTYVCICA